MSKTKNESQVKEEKAAPVLPKEAAFSFEALKEHSKELFGVKPEILEGALFYIKDRPITKTEAKKQIDAFLSKEV
ncbi:hypothetical protein UP15_12150 [Bacillus pumilus]|uniref:YqzN/YkzM domain-containing protein n=2 Tax=Bacillus TaxID=1386 RepID=A0A653V8T0_BACAB|nr:MULTISPECIES: hypothetical protein [Bacillus]AMM89701.1 hypothetical protein UP15_12150 [Bacillus pumilus]EDW22617.1 hypothetical bacteriophage protein [Bacillus pumilus ATCC 7061]MBB6600715.1 hypothetical protein [Bacillus pumilus]MCI9885333.1 hypothetical protein [Bacillus altitudinis]MCR4352082.1 hypothetical protein [Bacillus pumilus]